MRTRKKTFVLNRDKKKCFYCGRALTYSTVTLDHFVPKSKGGTRDIANLFASCYKCNTEKGDLDGDEYLKRKYGKGMKLWIPVAKGNKKV